MAAEMKWRTITPEETKGKTDWDGYIYASATLPPRTLVLWDYDSGQPTLAIDLPRQPWQAEPAAGAEGK
jgi:hypothetical protein